MKKVQEYSYQKLFGEEGKLDASGAKVEAGDCIQVYCMDKVIPSTHSSDWTLYIRITYNVRVHVCL